MLDRLKALAPDRSFPAPELIAAADAGSLRRCGFSASKAATIRAIAAGRDAGGVPYRAEAGALSDRDLVARLTAARGIGRWTVETLLIYSLERSDVLPPDDLGVREGYRQLKTLDALPGTGTLRALATAWAPHRTVATWYLWRLAERARQVRDLSLAPEPAPTGPDRQRRGETKI